MPLDDHIISDAAALMGEPLVGPPSSTPDGEDENVALARRIAAEKKVDPDLILAQMTQESGGKKHAKSWAGASGLMQLTPGTAKRYGVTDIGDPTQNITGGVTYMSDLLKMYKGDRRKALAAYNAGEGVVNRLVKKHGDKWFDALAYVSNDKEVQAGRKPRGPSDKTNTQNYVNNILGNVGRGAYTKPVYKMVDDDVIGSAVSSLRSTGVSGDLITSAARGLTGEDDQITELESIGRASTHQMKFDDFAIKEKEEAAKFKKWTTAQNKPLTQESLDEFTKVQTAAVQVGAAPPSKSRVKRVNVTRTRPPKNKPLDYKIPEFEHTDGDIGYTIPLFEVKGDKTAYALDSFRDYLATQYQLSQQEAASLKLDDQPLPNEAAYVTMHLPKAALDKVIATRAPKEQQDILAEVQAQKIANPSVLDNEAQARAEINSSTPTDRFAKEYGIPSWLLHLAPGSRIADEIASHISDAIVGKTPATDDEVANRMEEISKERRENPISIEDARDAVAKGKKITELFGHYGGGAVGGLVGDIGHSWKDLSGLTKFNPVTAWLVGPATQLISPEALRIGQGLHNIQSVTRDGDNGLAMTFAQTVGSLPSFASRLAVMRTFGMGNVASFAADSALPPLAEGHPGQAIVEGAQGAATGRLFDIAPAFDRAVQNYIKNLPLSGLEEGTVAAATKELQNAFLTKASRAQTVGRILGKTTELGVISLGSGAITYTVTGDAKAALDSAIQMGGLHALNIMGSKFPRIMQFRKNGKVTTLEVKPSEDGTTATVSEIKNEVPPEVVDVRIAEPEPEVKPIQKKAKAAPLPKESPFKSEQQVATPEGPGKVVNDHLTDDGSVFVQLEGDKGISLFKPEALKPAEEATVDPEKEANDLDRDLGPRTREPQDTAALEDRIRQNTAEVTNLSTRQKVSFTPEQIDRLKAAGSTDEQIAALAAKGEETLADIGVITPVTEPPVEEKASTEPAKGLEPTGVDKNGLPKSVIHEKGELGEAPVHRVTINGRDHYIQRIGNMNSGSSWWEVERQGNSWTTVKEDHSGETYHTATGMFDGHLGDTKADAISKLQVNSADPVAESTKDLRDYKDSTKLAEEEAPATPEFDVGDPVYLPNGDQADVMAISGDRITVVNNRTGQEMVVKPDFLKTEQESKVDRYGERGAVSLDFLTAPVQKIAEVIHNIRDRAIAPLNRLYKAGVSMPAIIHAYSRISVPFQVKDLLSQVFPDTYTSPERMAETIRTINLDNMLDGYYQYRQRSQNALTAANTASFNQRAGDPNLNAGIAEAAKWQAKAEAINSAHPIVDIIDELHAAQNNPEIMANIERWRTIVNPKMEALYKEVKGLAEDEDLPSRGHFFDARINLLPDFKEEAMKAYADLGKTQPQASYSNYKEPFGSKDQYDRAASFTGNYSTDANAVLTNVLGPRLTMATRLNFYQSLIDTNNAVYGDKPDAINGKEPVFLKISLPESSGPHNRTRLVHEGMWVDPDLAVPIRRVLNTDLRQQQALKFKYLNAFQVAQAVDLVAHLKNVHTVLAYSPKTGNALGDAVMRFPGLGSVDSIRRIAKTISDVAADTPEIRAKQAEMATNGMLRPEYPHHGIQKLLKTGTLLHKVDTAARMVMYDFFDKQVENGNVTGTPEEIMNNRRNFVQQIGEYNDRLMSKQMADLKASGLSPFVVAGTTFNRMALKMMTGDPGFKVSSTGKAAQLRAVNLLSAPIMTAVVPAMLNLATTGSLGGRPGTPVGAWDYGSAEDEKGKHEFLDLAQMTGHRRAWRLTGLNSLMAGLKDGSRDPNEIIGNMIEESVSAWAHPWMGPAPGFYFRVATGRKFDLRGDEHDYMGPRDFEGGKQVLENLRVAVRDTNQLFYSIASTIPGLNQYTSTPQEREPLNVPYVPEPLAKIGKGLFKTPLQSAGWSAAKTPATKLMDQLAQHYTLDPDNEASRAEAAKLLEDARTGTPDAEIQERLSKAVNAGTIKLSQVAKLKDNLTLSPTAVKFKYMVSDSIPDILRIYERMTPKERGQSWGVMLNKVANLVTAGKVSANDSISLQSMGITAESYEALKTAGAAKQDKALDKFNAEQAIEQGQQPDLTGMTKGEITSTLKAGSMDQKQQEFAGKTPAQQLFIYSNLPPEEKEAYKTIVVKTIQTLSKKKGMTTAEADVLRQLVQTLKP